MTLFYPDVSNCNWTSFGELTGFLDSLKAQGFSGVVHKCTQGVDYTDPYWPTFKTWCENNDMPWLGYHYCDGSDPSAQAAAFSSAGGGQYAMLDVEDDSVTDEVFWGIVDAFNRSVISVTLAYIPRWFADARWIYNLTDLSQLAPNQISLVSSDYTESTGTALQIYAAEGGDTGPGWEPYHGGTPAVWQYTDKAAIFGITADCNAYLGNNLNDLFTGNVFK
jgi:GH25 family lysozyme M1 (1,4-beta-N-acetylmuramidase)